MPKVTITGRSAVAGMRRDTCAPAQPPIRLMGAMIATAVHCTGPNRAKITSATRLMSSESALFRAFVSSRLWVMKMPSTAMRITPSPPPK